MTRDPQQSSQPDDVTRSERERSVVVVIDSDPGVRWSLEKGLSYSGYVVRGVSTAGQALRVAHQESIAVVVMELLPEAGLTVEVLSTLVETPHAPCLICTSVDASPQTVIECMRRGAADFLVKPFSLAEVRASLGRALATAGAHVPRSIPGHEQDTNKPSLLVGISPLMQELRAMCAQVAQTDLNCLVRGESGTGKDLVAREIHRLSQRRDFPFIKVNCSALPEQLLESELFGYEKGAFTGAITAKPGRFNLAHKGIIFLDEIGDMHPNLQSKILQVIEHKEFTKLGGTRSVRVDVQIIAATNTDLEQRTREGTFREDLYFRLNEVCIWAPPLSTRKEDVPLLVYHFIQKHGEPGGTPFEITGEDLAALSNYEWTGNVRELESTVKRWLALGAKELPTRKAPVSFVENTSPPPEPAPSEEPAPAPSKEPTPEEILQTLEAHHWNRRRAAEALGISYQALRRRIDKYGLDNRA